MNIQDIIKILWNKFKDTIEWTKFLANLKSVATFGYKDIEEVLKKFDLKYYEIQDTKFKILNIEDAQRFLEMNISRIRRYEIEYDCENFADVLRGQAQLLISGYLFGRVNVYTPKGKHALNFIISKEKEFFYIEPQTNSIFNLSYGKRFYGYKPYFIYV